MPTQRLSEAKGFAHGTVRSWKVGTVMKTDKAWTRLARDKVQPTQPVPEATPTPYGGDPYSPASPYMADALAQLASKFGEEHQPSHEASEELEEKIQSPSTAKGTEAYVKSLAAWSKAASKVAGSYLDRLGDARPQSDSARAQVATLSKLLQVVAGELGQIADIAPKIKGGK